MSQEMFFKNYKKIATEAATDNLRMFVGINQYHNGLPVGFWHDPFIIGFFGFMIGMYSKLATNNRISPEKLIVAISDTFTNLSNLNGAEMAKEYTEYSSGVHNPDFEKGSNAAGILFGYKMGILRDEDHNHEIVEAKRLADKMNGTEGFDSEDPRERVLTALIKNLYFDEIKSRFNT